MAEATQDLPQAAEASGAPAPAPAIEAEPTAKASANTPECPKCEECPPCKAGAPAWMATFADMATLLMAFFVLILSFAEMNVPKFKQINGSLKNSFGVQRIVPVVESPKGTSIVARHFSPAMSQPTPLNVIRQDTEDDRKDEVELKTDVAPEAQQALEQTQQALAQEISRGEAEVKLEGGKVVVEMTATPSGGGAGARGSQTAGNASSGGQTGGPTTTASQEGGSATGPQGGGPGSGTQAGAAARSGTQQAGVVSQGEIEFYAKVADAQAQTTVPVEVRDRRTSSQNSGGGKGSADMDAELARVRQALAKEIASGQAEVERDGARIVIRLAEQGSFRSGSADLQPAFMQVLNQVGSTVAQSSGRIFIEGHTDNVPVIFNERFRSNWDLSAARSASVADYLSARAGVQAGRMSVAGYADTRPLDDNDSASGRARNRRIEVIIDGGT